MRADSIHAFFAFIASERAAAGVSPKAEQWIMLAITSTMKFGELPGNVILRKSEANLPKKCVINITQIKSVDKTSIKEKIGTLSKRKMDEVYEGLKLVLTIPPQ